MTWEDLIEKLSSISFSGQRLSEITTEDARKGYLERLVYLLKYSVKDDNALESFKELLEELARAKQGNRLYISEELFDAYYQAVLSGGAGPTDGITLALTALELRKKVFDGQ